ncbi:hypothetical protein EOL96_07885, partial [Candidatus Saccharibacteria bacterium]|nr:hypothetical protein [Candidatus Saccharibacteria bacterium]
MAKRKKRTSRTKKKQQVPEHTLPAGFWSQVGAIILIALAFLYVISWFGAGGPVVEWLNNATTQTIGYAVYALPVLFVYAAVEIFRAEENRLPWAMKLASVMLVVEFAGLFGLMHDDQGVASGGFVGDIVNGGMLALVDSGVAAFVYVLFIVLTLLFVLRISPKSIVDQLVSLTRTDSRELEANVKVMREAAKVESAPIDDFKLNAGVPIAEKEPSKRLSTLRGSVTPDKQAEEQSALVMASDPNWQPPSLDLLEKKQSPANAGDIEHNAATIRDTLHEFNIDVRMEGANIGPKVTQYTLSPPSGVKLSRISALETNLALNLAASSLRIEAPIPGKRAVGIEVPNIKAADVRLYGMLSSPQWKKSSEPLSFAIGKDISGDPVFGKLNKMPHLLIAGQTGSGKSVMINS